MSTNKPRKTTTEDELFKQAMKGVKPLIQTCVTHAKSKPPYHPTHKRGQDKAEAPTNLLNPNDYLEPISGTEIIYHKHSSISDRLFKQLKQGKLPIKAELDLHQLNISQASHQVNTFINHCYQDTVKVARIIHGKGDIVLKSEAKLKTQLNAWLSDHYLVLAFCSCQAKDGGTGAVYVLLRTRKECD